MFERRSWITIAAGSLVTLSACGGGGGGGGSGSFESTAQLLSVVFPDPGSVNIESVETAPNSAPLAQQIVFTFTGAPDPNRISSNTILIRDAAELPVPGAYDVDGAVVTFTPALPVRALAISGNGSVDTGGTGLLPGANYTIRLGPQTFSFVASVAPALRAQYPDPVDPNGVLIGFKTTTNTNDFYSGLPPGTPLLVSSDPLDGETGISPNLYSDPDGLFPPRRNFTLTFDRALRTDVGNLSDAIFQLLDLDDRPGSAPNGLPLGVDVKLLKNDVDESIVEVTPSGILPFGHLLALVYPNDLKSLSEPGTTSGTSVIAATFTTASTAAASVRDTLVEDFDSTARRESDPQLIGTGNLPADLDRNNSGILQAAFAFQGDGILGEFKPPAPAPGDTRVITFDTSRQSFPLPDGSTPNAPPGFEVIGGVFPFTEIDIPDGIVIKPLGPNPLVMTATGSVRIAGDIVLAGEDGTPENAYDSAVTSVPGGAGIGGGGRGGESHPIIFFPTSQVSYLTMVDPLFGGTGFGLDPADGVMKRIGGTGGTCGCLDTPNTNGKYGTNQEIDCSEFRGSHNKEKVPGGGGGSMLGKGLTPGLFDANKNRLGDANGFGNVFPDGTGHYTVVDEIKLPCGVGGQHAFFADGNAQNDFFGSKGQLRRLIGGQGGGGGASLTESYYCGLWCDKDQDTGNDALCGNPTDFGNPPNRAGAVGDARGGGGGAGGGALLIQALGEIKLEPTAGIDATGGRGMGGEGIGCSYWGGGGGGGAGGMVVLQSGTNILLQSGSFINVTAGAGDKATTGNFYFVCDDSGAQGFAGDGGTGGVGLIQLQVPAGQVATVVNTATAIKPLAAWVDSSNTLNPVEFTPISVALSTWYDLGRVTQRPPASTNPIFSFGGLDAQGYVITNVDGTVASPSTTDIEVGYLGQIDPVTKQYKPGELPRADFIPTNAKVRVEFQGANPIAAGSKEIDVASIVPSPSGWSPTPTIANGKQFIRWRVTFDITADGSQLETDTRLPMAQSVQVHADF